MRVNFEGPFAHFTVAALGRGYNGHLMGHLPPWGKDFDLVWAATKAFFDADGEQPVYIGRPDSILFMDESVVQVAQILGVFGDKTVGFFGMGSSPPGMYYYSSF